MPDQLKFIRRFFRRVQRSLFNSIPNDGPQEIDLSKLRPQTKPNLEFSPEWQQPEKPSSLPSHTKT